MHAVTLFRQKPITLGVIIIAALLLLTMHVVGTSVGEPFLYRDAQGDTSYFRMLAPIFLHGGLLHLAMNGAILYRVGGDIEATQGSIVTLSLVIITGLFANVAQATAFAGNFGGLSGVVFGLFGYALVLNRLAPRHAVPLPSGILFVCIIFLVLGYAYNMMVDHIDSVSVYLGNEAHLGGFAGGALSGAIAGLFLRTRKKKNTFDIH